MVQIFFKMLLASLSLSSTMIFSQSFTALSGSSSSNPSSNLTTAQLATIKTKLDCVDGFKAFDPNRHKEVYKFGIHITTDEKEARSMYGKIFGEYLTATAGQRFEPPIKFETVPLYSWGIQAGAEAEELDFFFANSGLYSCIGLDTGAQPLVTTVSRLTVRGHTFDLDVNAGVIATREDRDDINSIEDLKGKIIGAGSISMVNAAQTQFYEMIKAGLSWAMDPQQVVFTHDQDQVVAGILSGEFDVGFIKTNQLEQYLDADGMPVDAKHFKILVPQTYVMDDGNLFPFLHSTDVYPESPVAALPHVSADISEEVQAALIALGEHMAVGEKYQECLTELEDLSTCENLPFPQAFVAGARCDTTKELALLALEAGGNAEVGGYRSSRSYFQLRTMQDAAGFLERNTRGHWQCTRSDSFYDGIICPAGYYKLDRDDFETECGKYGLGCKEGWDCYCKPCVEAFEVDIYPYIEGETDFHDSGYTGEAKAGCDKMSLCGVVEQTRLITFRAYDNRKRVGATVKVLMHMGSDNEVLEVTHINDTWAYEFTWSQTSLGVGIMEVFVNDEQVPESPIRVQIVERNCEIEYKGQSKTADENGICQCSSSTIDLGGNCINSVVFFVIISIAVIIVVLSIGLWFLNYKKRQADQMWLVNVEELHFDDPVEVIGQGSFGVVLLAEYRGTKVAIKRILNGEKKHQKGSKTGSKGGSFMAGETASKEDSVQGSAEIQKNRYSQSRDGSVDVESQCSSNDDLEKAKTFGDSIGSRSGTGTASGNVDMDFLVQMSFGRSHGKLAKWFPWLFHDHEEQSHLKSNILGVASGASTSRSTVAAVLCPWLDKQTRRKNEFMLEMRLLSRLRHPCITTVMGAVISPIHEPMLVMEYMEYGSLHDLLRNETMYAGGEVILQIMRDIAQGIRYLHSSKPPILHGDLKAKNILVDSRFRAKVGDFGLSTKKKNGLSGTPYFLAPEYLRGKTEYNSACDIYAIGIILWEIYARKNPYEGQNPRNVLRNVCDPRKNLRPTVPDTCPPKMVDIMKKCWSPDPFFRPQAKDLDLLFMDMATQDAEPLDKAQQAFKARTGKATGDMLYEVFPKHIADALKAGQKVEPENHENVTVFFSDIVHFTDISNTMHPVKVCQMLDRLYLAFDKLAGKHGVFKVETIGDAYMGVTNLDGTHDHDHVKQIAEFAIDAIEAAGQVLIDEDDPKKGYVRLRVGFHSGPVVSNVIGSLNPRYGLFGDTVNTASRMESNSYSQKILCSATSAKLLKEQAPDIPITKRGKIGVKGKGDMTVYWVGSSTTKVGSSADKDMDDGTPHVNFAPETVEAE